MALAASVLPGFAILMLLGAIAFNAHFLWLQGALRACAAVAVGLAFANAIEMTWPRRHDLIDLAIAAAVAIAVLLLHASLVLTFLIFVPLSFLVPHGWRMRV